MSYLFTPLQGFGMIIVVLMVIFLVAYIYQSSQIK